MEVYPFDGVKPFLRNLVLQDAVLVSSGDTDENNVFVAKTSRLPYFPVSVVCLFWNAVVTITRFLLPLCRFCAILGLVEVE